MAGDTLVFIILFPFPLNTRVNCWHIFLIISISVHMYLLSIFKNWVLQTKLSAIHSLLHLGGRYCIRQQFGWAYQITYEKCHVTSYLTSIFLHEESMIRKWPPSWHEQWLLFTSMHGMLGSARALVRNVGSIFLEDQSWSLKKTEDVYIQIQIIWGTLEV